MSNNRNFFKTCILLFLVLFACKKSYYSKVYDIDKDKWHFSDVKQFNVEITDISRRYDVLIHIRNSVNYRYSNIFLFVDVLYPDNIIRTDTVEGFLANNEGKWLGKGRGKYRDNTFIYKKSVLFPQKGTYIFRIEQAMRDDTLKGISSIGLELKYSNDK